MDQSVGKVDHGSTRSWPPARFVYVAPTTDRPPGVPVHRILPPAQPQALQRTLGFSELSGIQARSHETPPRADELSHQLVALQNRICVGGRLGGRILELEPPPILLAVDVFHPNWPDLTIVMKRYVALISTTGRRLPV